MIRSFADPETELFFLTGKSRRIPPEIALRLRARHFTSGTRALERPVTAELALLLGRSFDQSAHYWLNLQAAYDLKVARKELGNRLERIEALTG